MTSHQTLRIESHVRLRQQLVRELRARLSRDQRPRASRDSSAAAQIYIAAVGLIQSNHMHCRTVSCTERIDLQVRRAPARVLPHPPAQAGVI
jgi:hypothetical protein